MTRTAESSFVFLYAARIVMTAMLQINVAELNMNTATGIDQDR